MIAQSSPLAQARTSSGGPDVGRLQMQPSSGVRRGDEWDWLHRNIRCNKPLIWWSICSRTSSSIIHPPVRHHPGSGAAQQLRRAKLLSAHRRLGACASINLSVCASLPRKRDRLLRREVGSVRWRIGCLGWYVNLKDKWWGRICFPSWMKLQSCKHMCPYSWPFWALCCSAGICFVSQCVWPNS